MWPQVDYFFMSKMLELFCEVRINLLNLKFDLFLLNKSLSELKVLPEFSFLAKVVPW